MRKKRKIFYKVGILLGLLYILSATACGTVAETEADTGIAQEESNVSTAMQQVQSELEVHYLDVGQGDATLILCDGHAMLIDAGDNSKGTAVQLYLNKQNVTTLDYVIGTHPDEDHIGGLDVILTKFDCKTIFLTDEQKDTNTYRDVLDALDYKGYEKTQPVVGNSYMLGSASFTILGPDRLVEESNDNSIAILLEHGNNRFYFEGDAGEQEEYDILNTGIPVLADVYKIGHHGSKTSTSDAMLSAVHPTYAVISVGVGNSYGHPNAETLNKLRANKVQVFRTDEQGTIVAKSDGETLTFLESPSESWQVGEAGSGQTKSREYTNESTGEQDVVTSSANATQSETEEVMVHITKTGKKYHSAGCSYLKESDTEVSLEDAKAMGLTPCSRCNPPQ